MQEVVVLSKEEYNELFLCKQYTNEVRELTKELYNYKLKEWENKCSQDRQKEFKQKVCKVCRCFIDEKGYRCRIPSDIGKPILSEDELKISYKSCSKFTWD